MYGELSNFLSVASLATSGSLFMEGRGFPQRMGFLMWLPTRDCGGGRLVGGWS